MKRTPFPYVIPAKAGIHFNPLIFFILISFLFNTFGPLPSAQAQELYLPKPGIMVHLSPEFNPPVLKGITVHPDNPFKFDFILDQGDNNTVIPAKAGIQEQEQLKSESAKLVKYFLSSITTPEADLWVNLSPYEKNRIVPQSFGQTDMGRDLLAQDYLLKQITASLIYPEDEFGKKFWQRIYAQAQKQYGTTNIPVNTFNKVWIVPEHAKVYEHNNTAFVINAKLKVMLEEDYLALDHTVIPNSLSVIPVSSFVIPAKAGIHNKNDINTLGSQIVRELVIPQLEKEINEGKNFAPLRQVYYSLVLAVWFKKRMKESLLGRKYMDQNKVTGIQYDHSLPLVGRVREGGDVELIYQQYLQAFKKGVYNYIKEEPDPATGETIPRKYFSGGADMNQAMRTTEIVSTTTPADRAMIKELAKKVWNITASLVNKKEITSIDAQMKATYLRAIHRRYYEHVTVEQMLQGEKSFEDNIASGESLVEAYNDTIRWLEMIAIERMTEPVSEWKSNLGGKTITVKIRKGMTVSFDGPAGGQILPAPKGFGDFIIYLRQGSYFYNKTIKYPGNHKDINDLFMKFADNHARDGDAKEPTRQIMKHEAFHTLADERVLAPQRDEILRTSIQKSGFDILRFYDVISKEIRGTVRQETAAFLGEGLGAQAPKIVLASQLFWATETILPGEDGAFALPYIIAGRIFCAMVLGKMLSEAKEDLLEKSLEHLLNDEGTEAEYQALLDFIDRQSNEYIKEVLLKVIKESPWLGIENKEIKEFLNFDLPENIAADARRSQPPTFSSPAMNAEELRKQVAAVFDDPGLKERMPDVIVTEAEKYFTASHPITAADHLQTFNAVKAERIEIASLQKDEKMNEDLTNNARLEGEDVFAKLPDLTEESIQYKQLYLMIKAKILPRMVNNQFKQKYVFKGILGKRKIYTQQIDDLSDGFTIYHADGELVPDLMAHLGRLWERIHNKSLSLEDRKRALAQYEWWFVQINPMGRAGASMGDAMSLIAQITLGFKLPNKHMYQDYEILTSTLNEYVDRRMDEFEVLNPNQLPRKDRTIDLSTFRSAAIAKKLFYSTALAIGLFYPLGENIRPQKKISQTELNSFISDFQDKILRIHDQQEINMLEGRFRDEMNRISDEQLLTVDFNNLARFGSGVKRLVLDTLVEQMSRRGQKMSYRIFINSLTPLKGIKQAVLEPEELWPDYERYFKQILSMQISKKIFSEEVIKNLGPVLEAVQAFKEDGRIYRGEIPDQQKLMETGKNIYSKLVSGKSIEKQWQQISQTNRRNPKIFFAQNYMHMILTGRPTIAQLVPMEETDENNKAGFATDVKNTEGIFDFLKSNILLHGETLKGPVSVDGFNQKLNGLYFSLGVNQAMTTENFISQLNAWLKDFILTGNVFNPEKRSSIELEISDNDRYVVTERGDDNLVLQIPKNISSTKQFNGLAQYIMRDIKVYIGGSTASFKKETSEEKNMLEEEFLIALESKMDALINPSRLSLLVGLWFGNLGKSTANPAMNADVQKIVAKLNEIHRTLKKELVIKMQSGQKPRFGSQINKGIHGVVYTDPNNPKFFYKEFFQGRKGLIELRNLKMLNLLGGIPKVLDWGVNEGKIWVHLEGIENGQDILNSADLCDQMEIEDNPNERPSMKEVAERLRELIKKAASAAMIDKKIEEIFAGVPEQEQYLKIWIKWVVPLVSTQQLEGFLARVKTISTDQDKKARNAKLGDLYHEISRYVYSKNENFLKTPQSIVVNGHGTIEGDIFIQRPDQEHPYVYRTHDASKEELSKYQAAIDQQLIAGATVELTGHLDKDFLDWIFGKDANGVSPVAGVELIYSFILPSHKEYRFVLKPGIGKGLWFENNIKYSMREKRIIKGIARGQNDVSLLETLFADQPKEEIYNTLELGKDFTFLWERLLPGERQYLPAHLNDLELTLNIRRHIVDVIDNQLDKVQNPMQRKNRLKGLGFELSRYALIVQQGLEQIQDMPLIYVYYRNYKSRRVGEKIDNDIPIVRHGKTYVYETKLRDSWGGNVKDYNQVLKYQSAIDQGLIKGATIEIKGSITHKFLKWALGLSREEGALIPGVEIIYNMPMPGGMDYRFVLKPAQDKYGDVIRGLAFYNSTTYPLDDQKIIKVIQKNLQEENGSKRVFPGAQLLTLLFLQKSGTTWPEIHQAFWKAADQDSAMPVKMARIQSPGGIDLTAKRMDLEVEKDKAQISQPMDFKALENIEIQGLWIKDIEIKPLQNLPELLGLSIS